MRFLCWVFGHRPEPGLQLRFSIRFHCTRCHRLVPGDLGRPRTKKTTP